MSKEEDASAKQLFSETTQSLAVLIRAELALLQSALSVSLTRIFLAIGIIICAAIIVLVALNVLATVAVAALTAMGLQPVSAGMAVGLGLLALALILVKLSLYLLRRAYRSAVKPAQTLGRDAQAIKAAYHEH